MIRSVVRLLRPAPLGMLALSMLVVLPATRLAAQIPDEYTNLKVLPEDITRGRLMGVMRGFTFALGVRCSTCHVGEEGRPLDTYDFASDDKAIKLRARQMLKMVTAINGEYLADLPQRREPNVEVTCATCHRGVRRPEPIELIVEHTMDGDDLDAAIQRYRDLRERYYGSAAYDFTDRPLIGLAQRLARDNAEAATRLLELNLEYNPRSAASFNLMASIAERAGDDAKAIEYYKKVLEIEPENRRARQRLEALGGGMQAGPPDRPIAAR